MEPVHTFTLRDILKSGIGVPIGVLAILAMVILPTKVVAWIMAWIVDALVAGAVGLTAEVARFLGDGYTSVQRPRLRSSLALSAAGAVGLVSLLLLSGPIAWVVGLAAVTVAVLFLLLEFLF